VSRLEPGNGLDPDAESGRGDVGGQALTYVYFEDEPGELCRRSPLWGLSRRTRAIDHLLYESNSGFWRWVTGGCGNVLSIGVVVIASTRPPPKRLLGLGQP